MDTARSVGCRPRGRYTRAPVATDVDESSQMIVGVANEDDGRPPVLPTDEVTGLGELLAAGEVLPRRGEELALLDRCHGRIAVPGQGKRLG